MNNAVFSFNKPQNEPIQQYLKGSKERELLIEELEKLSSGTIEIPLIIGGKEIRTGKTAEFVMPHNHKKVLAVYHQATEKEVQMAIDAALAAKPMWENISWLERSSIMLRIAELISKKYRYALNAATMLGQGKNAYQAEIDSACETIDFLRYNVFFASQIYQNQPSSELNQFNRLEYRALEGFVFAISPFNFTAIASNLNLAPVMMGNATDWKPATTAILSNYILMKIFKEAGLPDGVVNFIPGSGSMIGKAALLTKIWLEYILQGQIKHSTHFGAVLQITSKIMCPYPRIVGETGGKDFIFVHNSATAKEVANAIITGSFEYQGQKCSAPQEHTFQNLCGMRLKLIL
jgi:1-pyrroline-5-carboxylate dehydrogenase